MRRIRYAGCTANSVNTALDTACDASGCISLSKFSANIDSQLKGKVVGYVSTVGALAVISKDGKARTAADPPSLAMDTGEGCHVLMRRAAAC